MASRTLITFQVTPGLREWYRHAAHRERMTVSEWLRGLATQRAAEVVPAPPERVAEMARDEEAA